MYAVRPPVSRKEKSGLKEPYCAHANNTSSPLLRRSTGIESVPGSHGSWWDTALQLYKHNQHKIQQLYLKIRSTTMMLSFSFLLAFAALVPSVSSSPTSSPSFATTELPTEYTTAKQIGDKVPDVTFATRSRNGSGDENPFEWKTLTSSDYFAGKRVVVFALPGAFTPTCSNTHLPGYESAYQEILDLGVDDVYCLSVNDAFVMRQWGLHQGLTEDFTPGANGFQNVKLIPDGAALFTRGMGMSSYWSTERGFGERSWRYSMIVNDGVIEKVFVEEPRIVMNSGPDPFEVSDSDTMVEYLKSVKSGKEEL
jgi:peroxiredoxin